MILVERVDLVVLNAKKARELSKKFYEDGINHQRSKILKEIESQARNGHNNYVCYETIFLYEDDYKFLENLGFEICQRYENTDKGVNFLYIKW